ncbi:MAG: hypothetical protein ACOYNY_16885 [Caldilineaceae bacterium]
MQTTLVNIAYEIQIEPGETFSLPQALVETLRPGRWLLMIRPLAEDAPAPVVRDHSAFLNSYAPEDEGLYDDAAA